LIRRRLVRDRETELRYRLTSEMLGSQKLEFKAQQGRGMLVNLTRFQAGSLKDDTQLRCLNTPSLGKGRLKTR
jgi:hypothetical protein